MPEQVGVFWVTQIGSVTLAGIALLMIYTFAKGRANADAVRTLASMRARYGEELALKEVRDAASRSDHAQWEFERQTRYALWGCYAVGIFAAPGLAELVGNVHMIYDHDGFLDWVNIGSADGIVTMAVLGFVAARIYEWRVFVFHRNKQFTELRDDFIPPKPSVT